MLGVTGGTAVLRFASAEAAERARKRMENEDVLGNRITVSFSPDGLQEEEEVVERSRPATTSSFSSALFLPVEKPRSPRRPRRALRASQSGRDAGVNVPERPYSPRKVGHASSCSPVLKSLSQVSGVTVPSASILPSAIKILTPSLLSSFIRFWAHEFKVLQLRFQRFPHSVPCNWTLFFLTD